MLVVSYFFAIIWPTHNSHWVFSLHPSLSCGCAALVSYEMTAPPEVPEWWGMGSGDSLWLFAPWKINSCRFLLLSLHQVHKYYSNRFQGMQQFSFQKKLQGQEIKQQNKGGSIGVIGPRQTFRRACCRNIFFWMLHSLLKDPLCKPISEQCRHLTVIDSTLFLKHFLTAYYMPDTMPKIDMCLESVWEL